MWETGLAIMIVGAAAWFSGRALLRMLRGQDKEGCGGGCAGCPHAPPRPPNREEEA
jgi:hypothetical protein